MVAVFGLVQAEICRDVGKAIDQLPAVGTIVKHGFNKTTSAVGHQRQPITIAEGVVS